MIFRFFPLFVFFLTVSMANAQEVKEPAKGPRITFAESMKDFGDIAYGDSIRYVFKFTNTGNENLEIKNVITTCSCTSRKYTEGPIAPGQSGELVVSFLSGNQDKLGRQNKVITILSNALNNPERVILICTILEKGKE